MAYREAWTNRAHKDYEAIIEYLLKERSVIEAKDFINDVEKQVAYVKKYPYMFQESSI